MYAYTPHVKRIRINSQLNTRKFLIIPYTRRRKLSLFLFHPILRETPEEGLLLHTDFRESRRQHADRHCVTFNIGSIL